MSLWCGWWGDGLFVELACVFVWWRGIALRGGGRRCGVAAWGLGSFFVMVLG